MSKAYTRIILPFLLIVLIASCKPDDNDPTITYNRKALIENIGNNLILPAYTELNTQTSQLLSIAISFASQPTQSVLDSLQSSLKLAWISWQSCSAFEFGPAANNSLRASVSTFPTDSTKINSNIAAGTWDLNSASGITAKGFPALDFLLHSRNDNVLLQQFTTDSLASNRKAYLQAVISDLNTLCNQTLISWQNPGGDYITPFTTNEGTDQGSPTGLLVNQFNQDYEILKSAKIGIPLGKKSLGIPIPEKTEAWYSGMSAELALNHLHALENLYLGRYNGNNGYGFDDILVELGAVYNGGLLDSEIKARFDSAIILLQNVPDPLAETITNDPTTVDAAYNELQRLVVLLKSDMPSVMGILITYQDNDGD